MAQDILAFRQRSKTGDGTVTVKDVTGTPNTHSSLVSLPSRSYNA
jgi:hypothetical protein